MTLARRIAACTRCPRLRGHCAEIARVKRRAYRDQAYWGKPVPSFGVASPRLLVVGLAPGAHGANRTGRVFTGDSSGDWLYRTLHRYGLARRAASTHRRDGQELLQTVVSGIVRCAPPQNRPQPDEIEACRSFLVEEVQRYHRLAVVVALGRLAFDGFRKAWAQAGRPAFEPRPRFGHGREFARAGVHLLASYHPSRQNTQTGRLTRSMFEAVFRRARRILGA